MSVHLVKRELTVLRNCCKPLASTVAKLSTKYENSEEAKFEWKDIWNGYSDIGDHLLLLNDQMEYLTNWSVTLNDQFHNEQAHRMNEVMYMLTLVAAIFIPAQFLTGVYGMNFKYMPEYDWKYSYAVFWAFIGFMCIITFSFFRFKKWM